LITDEQQDTRLTFALPLATAETGRDGDDLKRFELLLATIERYCKTPEILRLLVICPANDLPMARRIVERFNASFEIELIDEVDLCPDLRFNPETRNNWPRPNLGWMRQQLIKLAIHERVRTPFYLTLDSDVLFVRRFGYNDLFQRRKAILNIQTESDYSRIFIERVAQHETRVREFRYGAVKPILQMERSPARRGRWYGETPVLMHVSTVRDLTSHISTIWGRPWMRVLLESSVWTEYSLYFVFVEGSGLLDELYEPGGCDSLLRFTRSLWRPSSDYLEPRELSNWDMEAIFDVEAEGLAVVVQSYLGYPVSDIARRLRPYLLPTRI
jgi:hypothetical protein